MVDFLKEAPLVLPMTTFKEQKRATLKDTVIKEITSAIVDGRLQPGDRLNESKIAAEMCLSKTPVREAISELVSVGILTNEPFKGTAVRGLTKKEAEELYSLRAILEGFAIDLALPKLGEEQFTELRSIVESMEESAERRDVDAVVDGDLAFHQHLVFLSGHSILLEIWERIYDRISLYAAQKSRFFKDLREDASLHRELLNVISSRDSARVKLALRDHMYHYSSIATELLTD